MNEVIMTAIRDAVQRQAEKIMEDQEKQFRRRMHEIVSAVAVEVASQLSYNMDEKQITVSFKMPGRTY